MKRNEFDFEIEKLKSVYGDKYYNGERYHIMWEELGKLPASVFVNAVKKLISQERFPPMMDKFKEVMSHEIGLMMERHREELLANAKFCQTCSNVGVEYHTPKGEMFPYVYQCHCTHGAVKYPAFPKLRGSNGSY